MWHELWERKQQGIRLSRKLGDKASTAATDEFSQLCVELDNELRTQIAEYEIQQRYHAFMIQCWQCIRLNGNPSQLAQRHGPVIDPRLPRQSR